MGSLQLLSSTKSCRTLLSSGNMRSLRAFRRMFCSSHRHQRMTDIKKDTAKRNIFLMGSPGSGKTTVGRILADKLQLPVVDIDNDVLEKHWKTSVSNKLASVGSENFIREEGLALEQFTASGCVVSLTGSNPMYKPAMDKIRQNGIVVFLNVNNSDIIKRLEMMKVNRIVGQTDGIGMEEILQYRQQFYETCYDLRIICQAGENPDSIAEKVISSLDFYDRHDGYQSTRQTHPPVTPHRFNDVVLEGLANDSGLYIPSGDFPKFSLGELQYLVPLSYSQRALRILERLIHPLDIPPDILSSMVNSTYNKSAFTSDRVFPVVPLGGSGNQFLVEMFHGPTASFKDGALQLMPHLFQHATQNTSHHNDERYLILVATSGDTGSAVLSGFGKLPESCQVSAMVLYPEQGISQIQKAQMVSAQGSNVHVVGVRSDFDFCQSAIKKIFNNNQLTKELHEKYNTKLSAANSINWGRLVPQIVYHISAYLDMVHNGYITMGTPIDLCIPTGNFGNILAAYYAKTIGVPFLRLICASNMNNVLTHFLNDGIYDLRNRMLHQTIAPAVDILKSSNLERYLFHKSNRDTELIRSLYNSLDKEAYFQIPNEMLASIQDDIVADWCSEDQCRQIIADTYKQHGYILDPHTAVAKAVADRYHDNQQTPMLIASTAHYGKFASDVATSLGIGLTGEAGSQLESLARLGAQPAMHRGVMKTVNEPQRHQCVLEADENAIVREIKRFMS